MNTAVKLQEVKIKDIDITEDTITAYLFDGRSIRKSIIHFGFTHMIKS